MPEGDTIRRLAERINDALRRRSGASAASPVTPASSASTSPSATLVGADAHGKHLLIRFDDGRTLYAHLRIDGSFVVGPAARVPEWRRRVELWMEDGRLTGVDVPILGVVATANEAQRRRSPRSRPVRARASRPRRSHRPHGRPRRRAAGRRPARPAQRRRVRQRLRRRAAVHRRRVAAPADRDRSTGSAVCSLSALPSIRTNAERGPQNTTGRRLHAADHWIYARRGRPCPLCGTVLDGRDERASEWGRVTVWCPHCQPFEPRRAVDLDRARRLLALHPARRQPIISVPRPRRPWLTAPSLALGRSHRRSQRP